MAIYPIKMLKDEQGNPFVPLTHITAVAGEEYTTTALNAIKQSAGHYKITNDDLTTSLLVNKVIAVRFDDVTGYTSPSYLKINNDADKPLYQSDGINYLSLDNFDNAIAFFIYTNNRFQLLEVGATASGAGHTITDTNGNVMTTRGVLHFDGAEVIDTPALGATTVKTGWISQKITLKDDTTTSGLWQPMLASAITLPQTGTYGIHIRLRLTDINTVGKEIGIRIKVNGTTADCEDWKYQYKRLKTTYNFYIPFTTNDTIMPELFIDNMTSTSTITIGEAYMFIEYIPTKEVDV